jgi:hypothetical protein
VFEDHFDNCNPVLDESGNCPYFYPTCPKDELSAGACPPPQTGYVTHEGPPPVPTQEHRPVWDPQSGEWWWSASAYVYYSGDGAMYETSGNGEIWCTAGWNEPASETGNQGYGVQFYTIVELVNSVYRLLFLLDDTTGDCLILEFYVGDWEADPPVAGHLRLISRVGGSETIVKTVGAGGNQTSEYWRYGRCVWARWYPPQDAVCADVDYEFSNHSNIPRLCVTSEDFSAAGASVPTGWKAGVGNASGDAIPICVDDFVMYRLYYQADTTERTGTPSRKEASCFTCTCFCMDPDDPIEHLFPNIIRVHFWGQCLSPMGDGCADPVDVEFNVYLDDICENPRWSAIEPVSLGADTFNVEVYCAAPIADSRLLMRITNTGTLEQFWSLYPTGSPGYEFYIESFQCFPLDEVLYFDPHASLGTCPGQHKTCDHGDFWFELTNGNS